MAIISCPECGGQVSDRAAACPHCGYPMEKEPECEKRYDLVLVDGAPLGKRSAAISAIRRARNCTQAEAEFLIDQRYSRIKKNLTEEDASAIKEEFEARGVPITIVEAYGRLDDEPETSQFESLKTKYEPDTTPRCPKCGSTSVQLVKRGFGLGKAAVGAVVLGPVGLLGGAIGSNKTDRVCANCGNKW